MSLGIVIANIAGPVRESPVNQPLGAIAASAVADAAPSTASVDRSAGSTLAAPAIPAAAPQLASSFTVVVLQLLNEHGVVTATIPSAQQLAAYRAGTATPPV